MDKNQKIIVVLLLIAAIAIATVFLSPIFMHAPSQPLGKSGITVYFFYGEECSHCHKVMPFIQSLQKKYPDVDFRLLEIWHNQTNKNLAASLNEQLIIKEWGVPEVIVGNATLLGDIEIPDKLEAVILDQKKKS
jgi:thiol-disulfide isomerase/thioredoxin